MWDTREEIHQSGHRAFVGGDGNHWDTIGELQFRFLLDHGLAPSDTLIDAGCGSLRGGVRFIRHLEPGHYLGLDKHIELIIYGVVRELGINVYRDKQPRFVISESFEFHKLKAKPTFGIAQSLFTHLTAHDVHLCLSNLDCCGAFLQAFCHVSRSRRGYCQPCGIRQPWVFRLHAKTDGGIRRARWLGTSLYWRLESSTPAKDHRIHSIGGVALGDLAVMAGLVPAIPSALSSA